MSKNYKHRPPHVALSTQCQANTKLLRENETLKQENNRLEMALKLISGEDKKVLLKAIDKVKSPDTVWFTVDSVNSARTYTSITLPIGTSAT